MKRSGFRLLWILALFAQAASLVHAAVFTPGDFAYGYPIVSPSEASAYRINLPLTIFQGAVRDDLGDMAVFNARGEVVPFFIRPTPAESQPPHPPEFLPLFPLIGAVPATAAEMRVTVDSPSTALMALTVSSSGLASGTVPQRYLLDTRAFKDSVAALQLGWVPAPAEFSGRVRIESSDDLDSWHTIVAAAPVASLQADGRALLQARIEVPPTRARFWRLTWVDGAPRLPITTVQAEFAQSHSAPDWESETVAARQHVRQSAEYVFDLSGQLPVERVDLQLPEANSVVVADLYSRRTLSDAWNFVMHGRFYRIHTTHGDEQNQPIDIPLNKHRYWLARIPNSASAGPLRLIAAWRPKEVVFFAQGNQPFLLAYGSSSLNVAHTNLSPFISETEIPRATLASVETLGGAARLVAPRPPFPRRRFILWLVLFCALVALGYMAFRLLQETNGLPPPG